MANTAISDFLKAVVEDAKAKGEEIFKKQNAANTVLASNNSVTNTAVVNVASNTVIANIAEPDIEKSNIENVVVSDEPKKGWYSKFKSWIKEKYKTIIPKKSDTSETAQETPKKKKRKHTSHDNDRSASSYDLNDPDEARKFWNKTTNM